MSTTTNMSTTTTMPGTVRASTVPQSTANTIPTAQPETKDKLLVWQSIYNINNNEKIQSHMRKLDPSALYYCFDRNKAIRTAFGTQNRANGMGSGNGTCVRDNSMYAARLIVDGKFKCNEIQLIAQTLESHGMHIYHVALLVKAPSGIRYISHANGTHYETLWSVKSKIQRPLRLTSVECTLNGKSIAWCKKHWKEMKKQLANNLPDRKHSAN